MIVLFPVLLILVVFALSNPQPVQLGFWPTDFALQAPLSLAVLAGLAIGLPARARSWSGAARWCSAGARTGRAARAAAGGRAAGLPGAALAPAARRCRRPMPERHSRLIAALDTADPSQARAWAEAVAPHCARAEARSGILRRERAGGRAGGGRAGRIAAVPRPQAARYYVAPATTLLELAETANGAHCGSVRALSDRLWHFHEIGLRPVWAWIMLGFVGLLGLLSTISEQFFSPELQKRMKVVNYLPHLAWQS